MSKFTLQVVSVKVKTGKVQFIMVTRLVEFGLV